MEIQDIRVKKTNFDKVLLIIPQEFIDLRGNFIETYNEQKYNKIFQANGLGELRFIQDDVSVSKKNVLKGIHGDQKTWKLTSCLKGKIYSVVINCDKDSKNFGQWQAFILSEENRHQLLIPPKFGNSYLVLSESAVYIYKQTTYYDPKDNPQFTYKWDDAKFNIDWPIENPILSSRDAFSNKSQLDTE